MGQQDASLVRAQGVQHAGGDHHPPATPGGQGERLGADLIDHHQVARSTVQIVGDAADLGHADDLDRLLPDGLATAGHRLWTAYDGTDAVGVVWVQLQDRSDGLHAFGYELEVREDLRRRGYGRAVVAAAFRACRDLGVQTVGLSVFGFNAGARALYEELGFRLTAQTMVLVL